MWGVVGGQYTSCNGNEPATLHMKFETKFRVTNFISEFNREAAAHASQRRARATDHT